MCKIDGCLNTVHARGLCQNHYRQAERLARGLQKPGPKVKPKYRDRPDKARRGREPKTHCPQNHEYTEENTYRTNGSKQCKTCRRERMRKKRESEPNRVGRGGVNKAKTHCPANHPYDEENTKYTTDGRRQCIICSRINGLVQNTKRYGITPADVGKMLDEQGGCCLICSREIGKSLKINIDHDHSCCPVSTSCGNCIRGLLCPDCNVGLGKFFDSPKNLRKAADYLESVES